MPNISLSAQTTAFLEQAHGLWINGQAVDASSNYRFNVIDPATGIKAASIAEANKDDIDAAVSAARTSFTAGSWKGMKPGERSKIITKIAELIEADFDLIGQIETIETGKPIQFAKFEAIGMANALRYYAGWTDKIHGTTHSVNMPGEHHVYTVKEPIGVAAIVTPWNFPLIIAAMKIGPALAAGCSIVWKPAELTSLSALRVAELMKEAGLPDGVLNIVTGRGHVTGAALVEHKDIDKVAFTGSTMTGIKIATSAAQGLKKCSLELGGKSPNIIFQDANLDQAIPMSAMGIFFNSGQTCTAPSRLYVHEDIADEFIEGIKTVAQSMKIGPGFDPDTQLGPLVSKQQLDRVQSFVSRAVDDGASIICGGKQYGTEGFFFEPTIIQTDNNDLEIVQEEVFGPVLVVQTFKDDAEAIEKANSNQYGLGAVLWTENLKKAHRIAREINAGTIGINTVNPADWDVPLGGFNQSGIGLENGAEGIEYYLRTKSVFVSL